MVLVVVVFSLYLKFSKNAAAFEIDEIEITGKLNKNGKFYGNDVSVSM